jgi:hypothetical protein
MNRFLFIALCAAAAFATIAAQAAEPASPNGGTGYIGLTTSAGMPGRAMRVAPADRMPPGEASTWVAGQPNANPDAPRPGAALPMDTGRMAMGGGREMPMPSHTSPMTWGTPD